MKKQILPVYRIPFFKDFSGNKQLFFAKMQAL